MFPVPVCRPWYTSVQDALQEQQLLGTRGLTGRDSEKQEFSDSFIGAVLETNFSYKHTIESISLLSSSDFPPHEESTTLFARNLNALDAIKVGKDEPTGRAHIINSLNWWGVRGDSILVDEMVNKMREREVECSRIETEKIRESQAAADKMREDVKNNIASYKNVNMRLAPALSSRQQGDFRIRGSAEGVERHKDTTVAESNGRYHHDRGNSELDRISNKRGRYHDDTTEHVVNDRRSKQFPSSHDQQWQMPYPRNPVVGNVSSRIEPTNSKTRYLDGRIDKSYWDPNNSYRGQFDQPSRGSNFSRQEQQLPRYENHPPQSKREETRHEAVRGRRPIVSRR